MTSRSDTSKKFSVEFGPPDARTRERVYERISIDGTERCWMLFDPVGDREIALARGPIDEDQAEIGRRARQKVAQMHQQWQSGEPVMAEVLRA